MKILELIMSGISLVLVSLSGGLSAQQAAQHNTLDATPAAVEPIEIASDASASHNWAGYTAQGGDFTAVGATWTIPKITAPDIDLAADAAWIGIGGITSRDLIQSGTQAMVQNGEVEYRAWVETLPKALEEIPLDVNAGDSVSVSLTQIDDTKWHLTFINNTTGKTYSENIAYRSSLSSAEWIEEMPLMQAGRHRSYVPLADFGSIQFTGAYAVKDGQRVDLLSSNAQPLQMINGNLETIAAPSTLQSSSSFSVSRQGGEVAQAASPYTVYVVVPHVHHRSWSYSGDGLNIEFSF